MDPRWDPDNSAQKQEIIDSIVKLLSKYGFNHVAVHQLFPDKDVSKYRVCKIIFEYAAVAMPDIVKQLNFSLRY